jgi:hypothetical protein
MIPKYRNRGILQLVGGLGLTGALVVMVMLSRDLFHLNRLSDARKVILLLLYLGSVTLWMVGSYNLARAKGHGRDAIGAVFLFFFVLGCLVPIAPFIFPGYVIFALKDKTVSGAVGTLKTYEL